MESSKLNMDELIPFDKLDHALEDKIKLQSLEDEEAYLEHLKAIFVQLGYWEEIDKLQKQLRNIWGKIYELKREMWCSYGKRTFQQNLQKEYGDSKLVIVHEYDPYVKPPWVRVEIIPKHVEEQTSLTLSHDDIQEPKGDIAPKQEELDLYANVIPIYDEYPESDCEEFVEALEEVVETSCVEIVHDLESMVETPTVESIGDLEEVVEAPCEEMIAEFKVDVEAPCEEIVETREEVVEILCMDSLEDHEEVVETIGMENIGSTIKCLEIADSHPRWEVGLQVVHTKKHEFFKVDFVLKKSLFMDHVHVERFAEFNATKIRGRIFSKKGRMIQVHGVMGNTSKLIFLVSLFNIWVWFIMQVRTRAFMLTCVCARNSPASVYSRSISSSI